MDKIFGYYFAMVLLIGSFVLLSLGLLISFKNRSSFSPSRVTQNKWVIYAFLSLLSFILSILVFTTIEIGFSWEIVWFMFGLMLIIVIILGLRIAIARGSMKFIKNINRKISDKDRAAFFDSYKNIFLNRNNSKKKDD